MTLTGAGGTAPPAAGTPTLNFIGTVTPTYSTNVATATGANIGTASSGRLVVVVFVDINGASNSSASVTIGGSSATVHTFNNGNGNPVLGIASLNVTTGTTATIVVTYGTAGGFGRFFVYTITGLSSFTPVGANTATSASNSATLSTTIATSAGGVVVAAAWETSNAATVSISGTETYTADVTNLSIVNDTGTVSHATGTATNASSTVTGNFSATGQHADVSAVSWR